MSKKRRSKDNRDERRFTEAQKAHMKAFGYTLKEPEKTEEVRTVKEQSDKISHQLPILEIKRDFVKISGYAVLAMLLLFVLKFYNIDFNAIRGFLKL